MISTDSFSKEWIIRRSQELKYNNKQLLKETETNKKTKPVCLIAQGHTGLRVQRYSLFSKIQ